MSGVIAARSVPSQAQLHRRASQVQRLERPRVRNVALGTGRPLQVVRGRNPSPRPARGGRLVCHAATVAQFIPFLRPEFSLFVGAFALFVYLDKAKPQERLRPSQEDWSVMERHLRQVDVRSISPFEVKSLVNNKGYLIVDVRKPEDFAMRHARGSVNIPLFRNAKSTSPKAFLRSALLATQGLKATEENELFTAQVAAQIPEGTGIVLVDESALGNMNRTMNKATGTKSRALIAAYMLSIADISTLGTILHCQGGVSALYEEGFPQEPRPGLRDDDGNRTDNKIW
eukprot:CAMPEP_0114264194 /NCGR_PEP_ID=MMETSP0058-20121206/23026_1 /TAXON_ID=36894 /ORGANISM="Pyramimonas parkeae, CCMP726" /LENGTH=285 /DNA_ID=CAMNT_0001380751 /DNA_START=178 /DNA_END=1035 /DNA_ORIENTATION=+